MDLNISLTNSRTGAREMTPTSCTRGSDVQHRTAISKDSMEHDSLDNLVPKELRLARTSDFVYFGPVLKMGSLQLWGSLHFELLLFYEYSRNACWFKKIV